MPLNLSGNIISASTVNYTGISENYPNIVKTNLNLWLDAGRSFSHWNDRYFDCGYGCQFYSTNPGCTNCNTFWTDLSVSYGKCTMNNGAALDYANGGSILFDGTNDNVTVPYNSYTMDFSSYQTICMWLKPTTGANTARRNPYNHAYGGSGTLTRETDGTISYYFGTNGGDNTPYVGVSSTFTVSENELAFITVTRSQPSNICRWYKNGVKYTDTTAGGYTTTTNTTSDILIGQGYVSNWIGNIYVVALYNKFFTDDEVLQNYNADRNRFGM
jgi:hypothetical protein